MGNLTVKESGEMASFISPNVSKITSFKMHFSPKQEGSGDPSPENVREITGWNGVETNTAQRNIYANTKNIYRKIFIPSGTTWTASCDGGGYVYVYDANQEFIDSWALSGTDETSGRRYKTITISSYDIYYVRIDGNKCQNPQFEFGTLSEYELVVENSITFSSDIETVYGGYVDLVSGELVVDMVSTTFGQMTGWSKSVDFNYFVTNEKISDAINVSADIKNVASSIYPSAIISNTNSELGISLTKGRIRVRQANMSMAVDAWLAEVKDKQFCYKLATPITHQLTPQQLSTLKGQNNFWSNADYVEIEYELTETFDIQKAKRKIILNQPHVESASGDIVTFDTDMKGKLKECKVYFSPVQEGEGDPSSDNIRPISGWTGVNIYDDPKYGGNIVWNQCLDLSTITISSSSSSVLDVTTTETGFNVALNDDVSTTGSRVVYFSIKWNRTQNHRYIFLCKISNTLNYSSLYIYHSNGSTNRAYSSDISEQFFGWESYDGSTTEAKTTLRFYIYGIDMKAGESFKVSDLMAIDLDEMFGTSIIDELYENTTTSAQKIEWFKNIIKNYNYREYNTGEVTTVSAINGDPYTSISINWTDEVGTVYGGYIDSVKGELVQTWYEFILDGVNNYLNSGSQLLNNGLVTIYDYIGSGGLNNLPKGPVNAYTGAIICNKFPLAYSRENEGIATGSGSLYIRLILDPSKLEDVSSTSAIKESMIKWQQENPLQIVYKLAEPIHYSLTPQQILTFKGINNVYSDTNGQMKIKYWKH